MILRFCLNFFRKHENMQLHFYHSSITITWSTEITMKKRAFCLCLYTSSVELQLLFFQATEDGLVAK